MMPSNAEPTLPDAAMGTGLRRNRTACDACHTAKVRCIPDPLAAAGECRRCARNELDCSYSAVLPRRRPARSRNQRIMELERRVQDLQLLLSTTAATATATTGRSASQDAPIEAEPSTARVSTDGESSVPSPTSALSRVLPKKQASPLLAFKPHTPPQPRSDSAVPTSGDVIERGVITAAQADRLLLEYRTFLDGRMLGICLPKANKDWNLRRSHPLLWLGVLCAASSRSDLEDRDRLAADLHAEMQAILDEHLSPGSGPGSRSRATLTTTEIAAELDLLQALLIFLWYHHEPTSPTLASFVSQARTAMHRAVALALRVGIGDDAPASSPATTTTTGAANTPSPRPHLPAKIRRFGANDKKLDVCREVLAWYWCSYNLGMKVREPMMLVFDDLVDRSIELIGVASDDEGDRTLLTCIRLTQISHRATRALFRGCVDASAGLSDAERDTIVARFQTEMDQWCLDCPIDIMNEQLMIEHHQYYFFLSELLYPAGKKDALSFLVRDPALPPLGNVITAPTRGSKRYLLAPWRLRFTRRCIESAHATLQIFNGLSASSIRRLSAHMCGRVFYALRFLLQLAHEIWLTGGGNSSVARDNKNTIRLNSLRIKYYIGTVERTLDAASDGGRYRVATMWLYALRSRLRPWHEGFREMVDAGVTPIVETPPRLSCDADPAAMVVPACDATDDLNGSLVGSQTASFATPTQQSAVSFDANGSSLSGATDPEDFRYLTREYSTLAMPNDGVDSLPATGDYGCNDLSGVTLVDPAAIASATDRGLEALDAMDISVLDGPGANLTTLYELLAQANNFMPQSNS